MYPRLIRSILWWHVLFSTQLSTVTIQHLEGGCITLKNKTMLSSHFFFFCDIPWSFIPSIRSRDYYFPWYPFYNYCRSLSFIEDYIKEQVLPHYGNTHTTTTVTSLQTTLYRHEARYAQCYWTILSVVELNWPINKQVNWEIKYKIGCNSPTCSGLDSWILLKHYFVG